MDALKTNENSFPPPPPWQHLVILSTASTFILRFSDTITLTCRFEWWTILFSFSSAQVIDRMAWLHPCSPILLGTGSQWHLTLLTLTLLDLSADFDNKTEYLTDLLVGLHSTNSSRFFVHLETSLQFAPNNSPLLFNAFPSPFSTFPSTFQASQSPFNAFPSPFHDSEAPSATLHCLSMLLRRRLSFVLCLFNAFPSLSNACPSPFNASASLLAPSPLL